MDRHDHCLARLARNALAFAAALASGATLAGGVRTAQNPRPGEIVVVRNVAQRSADRAPVAPGMAMLVDASPKSQVDAALGLGTSELSDADAANLNATPAANRNNTVTRVVNGALAGVAGPRPTSGAATGGNAGAAVFGNLGSATSGIGARVTGALSQLPMAGAPAGAGH